MRAFRAFALCAVVCLSMSAMGQKSTKSSGDAVRGNYLATQTGLCQDCHSPRDEKGQYVQEKWLQGAYHVLAHHRDPLGGNGTANRRPRRLDRSTGHYVPDDWHRQGWQAPQAAYAGISLQSDGCRGCCRVSPLPEAVSAAEKNEAMKASKPADGKH